MKSLKTNLLLNMIKTFSVILYPLITFPYASRVLMPENIGKVSFVRSYISYFMLLAVLGLTTYAIRECASIKDDIIKLKQTVSQLLSLNIITSVFAYLLLFMTLYLFPALDKYCMLILLYSLTIFLQVIGIEWLTIAMEDFYFITIRTIAVQCISIVLLFLFVRKQDDYFAFTAILVFSSGAMNILNFIHGRKYCDFKFTFNIDFKRHLNPILLLFAMTLSQTIFNHTDVTMLGLMIGDYEVGLYSTAFKVMGIIASIVQSTAFVLIPRLSYFFANNDFEGANLLLRKVLSLNLLLGVPLVVGSEVLAEEIFMIVGGNAYVPSGNILRILMISFLFSLVGGSFLGNAILIPMKKEGYYNLVCWVTAVANVILNYMLIPIYGAIGASIATGLNGVIIFLLLLLKIDKRIRILNLKQIFYGPVFGSCLLAMCCFFVKIYMTDEWICVLLSTSIGVVVYCFALYLFKDELFLETLGIVKRKLTF